jgi:hypothetical protein
MRWRLKTQTEERKPGEHRDAYFLVRMAFSKQLESELGLPMNII